MLVLLTSIRNIKTLEKETKNLFKLAKEAAI